MRNGKYGTTIELAVVVLQDIYNSSTTLTTTYYLHPQRSSFGDVFMMLSAILLLNAGGAAQYFNNAHEWGCDGVFFCVFEKKKFFLVNNG